MYSLYVYTSQYQKENFTVRCIIFSLRTDIEKHTMTFYATNFNTATYNFAFKKNRQTRARKADESVVRIEENSFIF